MGDEEYNSKRRSSSSSNGSSSGSSSSTKHACAACRHQRRKCKPDCVMAPFFQADKMEEFLDVHKIFGVSNVAKCLKSIPTQEIRKPAADSFKWEASVWKRDPVNGPLGAYNQLKSQLQHCRSGPRCTCTRNPIQLQQPSGHIIYNNGPPHHGISSSNIVNGYHHHQQQQQQQHNFSMPTQINNGYDASPRPAVLYSHPIYEHHQQQSVRHLSLPAECTTGGGGGVGAINKRLEVERSSSGAMEYQTFNNNFFHETSSTSGSISGNIGAPISQLRRQPKINNPPPPPPPPHQFHTPPQ